MRGPTRQGRRVHFSSRFRSNFFLKQVGKQCSVPVLNASRKRRQRCVRKTWRSNVAGEKLLLVEGATKYYFSHLFTCKPAKAFHLLGALRLDLPPIHRWKRLAFDWSIITKLTRTYFTDLDILASLKFWTTSALTRTWHKKRGKFLKRAKPTLCCGENWHKNSSLDAGVTTSSNQAHHLIQNVAPWSKPLDWLKYLHVRESLTLHYIGAASSEVDSVAISLILVCYYPPF